MPETPLDTALFLHALGYRCHPVVGKDPVTTGWTSVEWTPDLLRAEFSKPGVDGVGLHLRGFLDFDCDGPGATETLAYLGLPVTVGWQSARGPHYIYRLTDEQIAAISAVTSRKVFSIDGLEVRFSPGYQSVLPPSGGRTWIRSLLDHEPARLYSIGWLLDAVPKRALPVAEGSTERGTRPGDVFNERGTWAEILEPMGYRLVGTRHVEEREVQDWLRPGGTKQLSATTGFCQSTFQDDKLFVFSSNMAPFEQGESYSKFEAFTLSRHDGDYSASANELAELGYVATLDVRVFDDEEPETAACEPVASQKLDNLLLFPGFVERVAAWHLRRSQVVDARAGAVAGIVTASWMLGRRVRLFDGTRPNLSVMVTGVPGCGKTEIERTVLALLGEAGYAGAYCRELTSGPALEDVLADEGNLLYVRDEAQDLLVDDKANTHLRTLTERIKHIFSSSKNLYALRRRANEKVARPPIIEPHLAVLLLGVPDLWERIPDQTFHDGFMARLLALELSDAVTLNPEPDVAGTPEDILEEIRRWRAGARFVESEKDGEFAYDLSEVPCTKDARQALLALKLDWLNHGESVELSLRRRGQEVACKLALIAGATGGGEVTEGIVEQARAAVDASIALKLARWEQRCSPGDAALFKQTDRVLSYLRRAGGVPIRRAYRNLHMSAETFRRLLVELVLRGDAETDGKVASDGSRFLEVPKFVGPKGCVLPTPKVE